MPKQNVLYRDLAYRLSEAHGFSPYDAADLYTSAKKALRPEFALWRLGESGSHIVVKMFASHINDGPQVGFLKSCGVPQLIASGEGDLWKARESGHDSRVIRILSDVVVDPRTSVQYFTMEYLPGNVQWSRPSVIQNVLDLLGKVQSSVDLHRDKGNGRGPSSLSAQISKHVLRELSRPDARGDTGRYAYNLADSIYGLQRELENDETLDRKFVVGLINRCVRTYMAALELEDQPPVVLAHRDTGLGNFRIAEDDNLCLFDFEHARWDNPLSDYVHLWMRLREKPELKRSEEQVIEHVLSSFGEERWFGAIFRMCVAEKVLGHLNYVVEHRGKDEGFDLLSLLSAGHECLNFADAIPQTR